MPKVAQLEVELELCSQGSGHCPRSSTWISPEVPPHPNLSRTKSQIGTGLSGLASLAILVLLYTIWSALPTQGTDKDWDTPDR